MPKKLKTQRSRNVKKLEDARTQGYVNSNSNLLKMFTSFLSSEKKQGKSRKGSLKGSTKESRKGSVNHLLSTQKNLSHILNKNSQNQSKTSNNVSRLTVKKSEDSMNVDEWLFSNTKGNNKINAILSQNGEENKIFDIPEEDMFDLGDLDDEIFKFDTSKIFKKKMTEDSTEEMLKHKNTNCYSPSGNGRKGNYQNCDTGERTTQILGTANSRTKNSL